ncbi:MAG: glycosyltransferase family 4 protein [Lachnospiraceae bacterium]|nr:glycosyltransferase family 4 protein [Lachnospiraceae bacterium]
MQIMIWGTGEYAGFVKEHIDYVNNYLEEPFYSIVGYIDNDASKQGTYYNQETVIHPSKIQKDHVPIIIGVYNDASIIKQIEEQIGGEYYSFFDFVYRDILIEKNISKWIPELSEKNDCIDGYTQILGNTQDTFFRKIVIQKMMEAFLENRLASNAFCDGCEMKEIIAILFSLYSNKIQQSQEVEKKLHLQPLRTERKSIKTIALYYTRYVNGGVERVVSLHMDMFAKKGYQVIFLVDEFNPYEDYELPESVIRVVLNGKRQGNMFQWFMEAADALKKYDVDILISHQSYWEGNFYLNRITKLLGCRFVIEIHNIFRAFALNNISFFTTLYQNADAVVCLSEVDKKFWGILGANSFYIPNPVVQDSDGNKQCQNEHRNPKKVLWIGRLEKKQKNIQDVIEIAALVKELIPDIQFQIVGKFENSQIEHLIKSRVLELELQDTVNFVGYYREVSDFYKEADVMIVTSSYEGFSMVAAEAMFFGVPIISYSMPYLELFRHKKGYVDVPQRDKKKMAEEIVALLNDDQKRKRLSEEAKENISEFKDMDLLRKWEDVFCSDRQDTSMLSECQKDYMNIVNLIIEGYTSE